MPEELAREVFAATTTFRQARDRLNAAVKARGFFGPSKGKGKGKFKSSKGFNQGGKAKGKTKGKGKRSMSLAELK